jgi:hypothetical protein
LELARTAEVIRRCARLRERRLAETGAALVAAAGLGNLP